MLVSCLITMATLASTLANYGGDSRISNRSNQPASINQINQSIQPASYSRPQTPTAYRRPRTGHDGRPMTIRRKPRTRLSGSSMLRSNETIVGFASGNGNFVTLVAAVGAAGLADELQSVGPFTVFAPTDVAFANLPEGVVKDIVSKVASNGTLSTAEKEALRQILLFHVLPKRVSTSDIGNGQLKPETLLGSPLDIQSRHHSISINDKARVVPVFRDVATTNGIVHGIDAVLIPPITLPTNGLGSSGTGAATEGESGNGNDLVSIAAGNPNFRILVAAVQAAGLTDALRSSGPFTLFAPTDTAFRNLSPGPARDIIDKVIAGTSLIPDEKSALANILRYHVLEDRVKSGAIRNKQFDTRTLHGGELNIEAGDWSISLNGMGLVVPVLRDLEASNGVLHGIDAVLMHGRSFVSCVSWICCFLGLLEVVAIPITQCTRLPSPGRPRTSGFGGEQWSAAWD